MWRNRQAKAIGLVVFTGWVVTWVRQGVEHHWHGFSSWESFFLAWFIHTIGVSIFSVFAAASIVGTHKFFVGVERKEDMETLVFYVVMTVLVGALAIAVVANAPEVGDDARLAFSFFG